MRGSRFVFAAALTFAACAVEDDAVLRALGEGCLLDSDCEGELICVFRRCHIECETDADCSADLFCMLGDGTRHCCQLDDEDRCALHSDCPPYQVCGPDLRCRDQCKQDPDCVSEQVCAEQNVCARPFELVDGRLPLADTGSEEGLPCAVNSECTEPLLCIGGRCLLECLADVDCPSHLCVDNHCIPYVPPPAECVPNHQVACDCTGGEVGIKICDPQGQWGPCQMCRPAGGGGAGG
ncbi:MAG: hypothetical protein JRI23_12170, partial [Deltaproteobacteria bacterium]|nr:hypothetical protein [Deltaproteobacteria bacterium]MBW2532467.1 hypothetical protein [Deltaproteobacteria bacterium]